MNKLTLLRKFAIRGNINPKTIGYVHPGCEISFATKGAALNYAKKRVVSALNYENKKAPFERGILVHNNTILVENDGCKYGVRIAQKKEHKGLNGIIVVHGHPDEEISNTEKFVRKIISIFKKNNNSNYKLKEPVAYPVSILDYRTLMNNPNEKKVIAYNSKGEYSSLTKIKASKISYYDIENEYNMNANVPSGFAFNLIEGIKLFLKAFMPYEKSEQITINEAKTRSRKISDFWKNNGNLYGVKYETNFGTLCIEK